MFEMRFADHLNPDHELLRAARLIGTGYMNPFPPTRVLSAVRENLYA